MKQLWESGSLFQAGHQELKQAGVMTEQQQGSAHTAARQNKNTKNLTNSKKSPSQVLFFPDSLCVEISFAELKQ